MLTKVFFALCLLLLLWIAYKIGKILLRILAGLAFLGLVAYLLWRFLAH